MLLFFGGSTSSSILQEAAVTQCENQKAPSPQTPVPPSSPLPKDICIRLIKHKGIITAFPFPSSKTPLRTLPPRKLPKEGPSLWSDPARSPGNPANKRDVSSMRPRARWAPESLPPRCRGPVSLQFILMCKHCNLQPGSISAPGVGRTHGYYKNHINKGFN